jgi:hypothetical protein
VAAPNAAPSYLQPSYHETTYESSPPKYEYAYGVNAQVGYKGPVNFGQTEARDGYSSYGEYHVQVI